MPCGPSPDVFSTLLLAGAGPAADLVEASLARWFYNKRVYRCSARPAAEEILSLFGAEIRLVFVDPYQLGLDEATRFIFGVRERHPKTLIVLFTNLETAFREADIFFAGERRRLAHYLSLDDSLPAAALEHALDRLRGEILAELTRLDRRLGISSSHATRRAVILSALEVESIAVRKQLQFAYPVRHDDGNLYYHGTYKGSSQDEWTVLTGEVGAGNVVAALQTERALQYFQPQVALFVGVAGGLKDVARGDIVVATKVYGYERGRAAEGFLPRPDIGRSSFRLLEEAKLVRDEGAWFQPDKRKGRRRPTVHIAPIAAGEKVVASRRAETFSFLRSNYSDAVAVEMEGLGFLEASWAGAVANTMVIRGVSDLIDDKHWADRRGWQKRAAYTAATFALHLLGGLVAR